jgi:hypothetical protein
MVLQSVAISIISAEAARTWRPKTLAFDPPVRHTRTDYAGVGMSFRLVRGCQPDLIFDHYRKREKEDGPFPELAARYNCALVPGPQAREKGTVQCTTVTFKRGIQGYGDSYYLVVRCESGWATHVDHQSFGVVVELLHKAEVRLYERVRQRLRLEGWTLDDTRHDANLTQTELRAFNAIMPQ